MIRKFLKKYGWLYIPGILFLALNSRIQTLAPKALGGAIDLLEEGAARSAVYRQAGWIVLIALLVFLTRFIWRMFIIMNARQMEVFLREEYFVKLQKLPVSFYTHWHSGDLMAYAINDVGAVRMTFGPVIAQSLNGIITGTLSIISMIRTVDVRLTVLALLPLPIAVLGILVLGGRVRKRFAAVQGLFAQLSGFVNESIMGIRVIKTFAREHAWYDRFLETSDDMREANVRLVDTSSLISPVTVVTFGLSYSISLIVGGTAVLKGQMNLGDLVAFQGYLLLIQGPVVALGRIVNRLQQGIASYKRLRQVYDEPEIPESDRLLSSEVSLDSIEARHLTFSYPDAKKGEAPALSDISFTLGSGQVLGIAGDTGSGKTALLQLLLKLHTADPGMLFVGGEDITSISAASLRDQVGYVPQDGFLFSTTIEENIRFYQPDLSPEDIREACRLSCILKEIESFPDGFNTEVGERGTHLSGGQKQRIALARALVRQPQLLILDDTLSAVDHITEKLILKNLKGVLEGRTTILISHRLTALEEADQILFLRDGQIIERGTHEELLAMGGVYAETYQHQQEGEDPHEE